MNENEMRCSQIRDHLECIADGNAFHCTKCGEKLYCCNCIATNVKNEKACPLCSDVMVPFTMEDYLDTIVDVMYYVSRNKEYRGCRITVSFGGPTVYVDTVDETVTLCWSTRVMLPLSCEACRLIDAYVEGLYCC